MVGTTWCAIFSSAIEINSNLWFVGKNVVATFPGKALKNHVDEEDKLNNKSLLSLGQRDGWIIIT